MAIAHDASDNLCLNPCSNGMRIEFAASAAVSVDGRLNPCSNGMRIEWFAREFGVPKFAS